MKNENTMANEKSKIRNIIDNRILAIKNKDIDQATLDYSEDALIYNIIDPLEHHELEDMKEHLKKWMKSVDKIIDYEITNTEIRVSGDVAWHAGLNHMTAVTSDMNDLDMWWRETTCYLKIKGAWKVVHAHISVPFDAESGTASVGLKPDSVHLL